MFLTILITIILINSFLQMLLPTNQVWYGSINKSPFSPPGYVFGIVWFILYLIISYSYSKSIGTTLFYVWTFNIILNILWTPIFFYFNNTYLSLIVIILMIVSLIYILSEYYQKDSILFYSNLLYLCWLGVAFYLNYYIYSSN